MKRTPFILLFALIVTLLASCTKDCYMPQRSLLGVSFIDSETGKPLTVKQVSVTGLGTDSMLYNKQSVSSVYLPLRLSNDTTMFLFSISVVGEEGTEHSEDTQLTVVHKNNIQFINPECGCIPYFSIKNFEFDKTDLFDKVELYNSEVTNVEDDVHIKIYM